MAKIYNNISDLIGKTPLVKLERYSKAENLNCQILAKIESFNPAGSVKDRIAKNMIENAEANGLLRSGATIIEPTSGNTGIGLALMCRVKGYRLILTMPETMSIERRNLLSAYGAEVVLTPGTEGMSGAIKKAIELAEEIDNSFIPSQFDNHANPDIHFKTTGPEIWQDTDGNIDFFVAGIGTGGTITGVGEYLKSKNPDIKIVAVEPTTSSVLSGGKPGPHPIQGIGAGFIPKVLNTDIIDEIIAVDGDSSFKAGRELAASEGILSGISSGAALFAATEIAKRPENKFKNIVVLLPDTGERYLSTDLFSKNE